MIIIILLLSLVLSIIIHLYFLVKYLVTKNEKFLSLFIKTAVVNILFTCIMIVTAAVKPQLIRTLNLLLFFWGLAGLIMALALSVQVKIFRNIWKRCKEPENFHYNFFEKKVLHSTVVKPLEIAIFFCIIPFLVFPGAYFVARLINIILFARL